MTKKTEVSKERRVIDTDPDPDPDMAGEDVRPASRRSHYHHGDLRQALLLSAEAEIQSAGVEGFSLRKVARRAGVSHAAPAHHFGDAAG